MGGGGHGARIRGIVAVVTQTHVTTAAPLIASHLQSRSRGLSQGGTCGDVHIQQGGPHPRESFARVRPIPSATIALRAGASGSQGMLPPLGARNRVRARETVHLLALLLVLQPALERRRGPVLWIQDASSPLSQSRGPGADEREEVPHRSRQPRVERVNF